MPCTTCIHFDGICQTACGRGVAVNTNKANTVKPIVEVPSNWLVEVSKADMEQKASLAKHQEPVKVGRMKGEGFFDQFGSLVAAKIGHRFLVMA